jgi:hypothetical protein
VEEGLFEGGWVEGLFDCAVEEGPPEVLAAGVGGSFSTGLAAGVFGFAAGFSVAAGGFDDGGLLGFAGLASSGGIGLVAGVLGFAAGLSVVFGVPGLVSPGPVGFGLGETGVLGSVISEGFGPVGLGETPGFSMLGLRLGLSLPSGLPGKGFSFPSGLPDNGLSLPSGLPGKGFSFPSGFLGKSFPLAGRPGLGFSGLKFSGRGGGLCVLTRLGGFSGSLVTSLFVLLITTVLLLLLMLLLMITGPLP